jgi:hypothetical protein
VPADLPGAERRLGTVVAEIDPYAVLGVPRTASRLEVARAYRALAKRWHPDAAGGTSAQARATAMARINQAWHILSNPTRRAEWDARHGVAARPAPAPHWTPAPGPRPTNPIRPGAAARAGAWAPPVMQRPTPAEPAEPSLRDSGWLALVVAGALLVLFIAGVGIVSQLAVTRYPWEGDTGTFTASGLSFAHPADWSVYAGVDDSAEPHGVVAHVVTFALARGVQPCTRLDRDCAVTGGAVPPGEASIVITRWDEGTPPIPEPVTERVFGLDADRIIGGEPAAFLWEADSEGATGWWQLSPPGFPDRWYEVVAEIRGPQREQLDALTAIDEMLSTLEFVEEAD